jgi:hypothetical protein
MTTKQPIGAHVNIKWTYDNEEVDGYYISFGQSPEFNEETGEYGDDGYGISDNDIFFYCDGEHVLKSLMTAGKEDFVVLSYELEYDQDDRDIERALLINELEHNK